MGGKKRDHFNPVLLLHRFANADGVLHMFDKRQAHLGVREVGPRDIYVHKHLYSEIAPDGSRRRDLDDFYTNLENIAAPIITKIINAARAGRIPGLSIQEKSNWDLFLYNQWRRVPDSYERFPFEQSDVDALIAEYETKFRPATDEERTYFKDAKNFARLKQNVRIGALKTQSNLVLDALGRRGLGVAVISKPNKSFVTGSFPVVKLTNPNNPQLDHPETEAWIAIAPDVAVTPSGKRRTERIVEIKDDRHVRAINRALFKQSSSIAGRSKELVASLAGLK